MVENHCSNFYIVFMLCWCFDEAFHTVPCPLGIKSVSLTLLPWLVWNWENAGLSIVPSKGLFHPANLALVIPVLLQMPTCRLNFSSKIHVIAKGTLRSLVPCLLVKIASCSSNQESLRTLAVRDAVA